MIIFDQVTISYADQSAPVLRQVDLHIREGDLTLVVGRTGTGKSTLLGAINGLVPHFTDSGSVLLAASILGATVMPHAIYAHSALTRDRFGRVDDALRRRRDH